MIVVNPTIEDKWTSEPPLAMFRHRELICCIQRHLWATGNFNGYVAIGNDHPFYKKGPRSKVVVKDISKIEFNNNWFGALRTDAAEAGAGIIGIDMYLTVHCGVNFGADHCPFVDKEVFPNLWWFGFDTSHAGDMWATCYLLEGRIIPGNYPGYEYRDFDYVKAECIKLADQLADLQPQRGALEEAAYNYFIKQYQ